MIPRAPIFLIIILAVSTNLHGQQAGKILIAAASDLKFALDSVITVFRKTNPGVVDVTYGSSGKLTEQIQNGAPFDIFFSADVSYPVLLREKGLATSEVDNYGVGRIVLWSRRLDPRKAGMKALSDPSIKKIAIANPMHAPYGKRAEEAIRYYKLEAALKNKLVKGENISQTAQFITSGAADIGIIAYSLALSPTMKDQGGQYFLIPEESHSPLEQGAVILKHGSGNKLAKEFFEFVHSKGLPILEAFGFKKP